jgi:hypothetical protein
MESKTPIKGRFYDQTEYLIFMFMKWLKNAFWLQGIVRLPRHDSFFERLFTKNQGESNCLNDPNHLRT